MKALTPSTLSECDAVLVKFLIDFFYLGLWETLIHIFPHFLTFPTEVSMDIIISKNAV